MIVNIKPHHKCDRIKSRYKVYVHINPYECRMHIKSCWVGQEYQDYHSGIFRVHKDIFETIEELPEFLFHPDRIKKIVLDNWIATPEDRIQVNEIIEDEYDRVIAVAGTNKDFAFITIMLKHI